MAGAEDLWPVGGVQELPRDCLPRPWQPPLLAWSLLDRGGGFLMLPRCSLAAPQPQPRPSNRSDPLKQCPCSNPAVSLPPSWRETQHPRQGSLTPSYMGQSAGTLLCPEHVRLEHLTTGTLHVLPPPPGMCIFPFFSGFCSNICSEDPPDHCSRGGSLPQRPTVLLRFSFRQLLLLPESQHPLISGSISSITRI